MHKDWASKIYLNSHTIPNDETNIGHLWIYHKQQEKDKSSWEMYEEHNSSGVFALLLPLYFQFLKANFLVSVITSVKLIILCKTLTNQRKHQQGLKNIT